MTRPQKLALLRLCPPVRGAQGVVPFHSGAVSIPFIPPQPSCHAPRSRCKREPRRVLPPTRSGIRPLHLPPSSAPKKNLAASRAASRYPSSRLVLPQARLPGRPLSRRSVVDPKPFGRSRACRTGQRRRSSGRLPRPGRLHPRHISVAHDTLKAGPCTSRKCPPSLPLPSGSQEIPSADPLLSRFHPGPSYGPFLP